MGFYHSDEIKGMEKGNERTWGRTWQAAEIRGKAMVTTGHIKGVALPGSRILSDGCRWNGQTRARSLIVITKLIYPHWRVPSLNHYSWARCAEDNRRESGKETKKPTFPESSSLCLIVHSQRSASCGADQIFWNEWQLQTLSTTSGQDKLKPFLTAITELQNNWIKALCSVR